MSDEKQAPAAEHEWLWSAIRQFVLWLDRNGGTSFDPYDVWGTRYGLWSRRLYYAKPALGAPLIAPIVLLEVLCPGLRKFLVQKQRFATADAHLALAFLNLHGLSPDAAHLRQAQSLGGHLVQTSIPGYRGMCWGYPFDWQNNVGLWRKNTPYITCTPYCFEAFLGLHAATGEARYLEIAASIAQFVGQDLKDAPTGPDAAAASYSPHDTTKVINASAYRSWVLFEAAQRWGQPEDAEKARRNLNFILQQQRPDGSWLYGIENPANAFIDHFHTCFVLKNLFKLNRHLRSAAVREAIQRGYAWYRRELFDAEDNPKSFAIQPRTQLVKLELYNVAEAIALGVLLRDEIPAAFALAQILARRLGERWQLADGHFVTRLYRGGFRHTLPFLRWPQAQLFYALTNLLAALERE